MARYTVQSVSGIKKSQKSIDWADALLTQILDDNAKFLLDDNWYRSPLPIPVREHRFHPTRKWRFDLAFIKEKLAIEIEGGVWIIGRHNRGAGFIKDMEKYNEATFYGWKLLRFTPDDVIIKRVLDFLNKYFRGEKHERE